MESRAETIKAVVSRIKYRSPDGFAIGIARYVDDGASDWFTVKGTIGSISLGTPYELRGGWEEHPRYGLQFMVSSFSMIFPTDLDGISLYLRNNIKNLGPSRSNALMVKYGPKTLEMLRSYPVNVAADIPGISLEMAKGIADEMKSKLQTEKLMVELEALFAGTLITRPVLARVASDLGDEGPALVRGNPYMLIENFRGVGFAMADSVAHRLGVKPDDPFRIRAALVHVMGVQTNTEGNVCLPRLYLITKTAELLRIDPNKIDTILGQLLAEERPPIVEENTYVYYPKALADEHFIADRVRFMLSWPFPSVQPIYGPLREGQGALKEDQAAALDQVARGQTRIFAITGAPGTGKTFLAEHIIESFRADGWRVMLMAPTGKAAKRLEELTGIAASTIHRALEPLPPNLSGKGNWDFRRNEDNPFDADLIIADESSMLANWLFARLLHAIKPDAMLVLIGDTNQLPSIGPGNVLKDLIAGGVPQVELDAIKRQDAGLIIRNCHRIKHGYDIEIPMPDPDMDFMFIPRSTEESIKSAIVTLLKRVPDYPKLKGIDPINDIQVIVPRRVQVELSCEKLNPVLQAALIGVPEKGTFQRGDKVIQTWNDYERGIMNGDVGRVLDVAGKSIWVRFENPIREVELPLYGNDLELAFALSGHKFQGDESPVVIIPIHSSGGAQVCQRPWIYTSISRAKQLCILVGQREEISKMIHRNSHTARFTRLQQLIRK